MGRIKVEAILALLPTEECVLWTGGLDRRGLYGQSKFEGKTVRAHRHVWVASGRELPAGMELDHLCRVQRCVNPAHLEPVTPRENSRRHLAATRNYDPEMTCPQGHEWTPENTYIYAKDGRRNCRTCNRSAARKAMAS